MGTAARTYTEKVKRGTQTGQTRVIESKHSAGQSAVKTHETNLPEIINEIAEIRSGNNTEQKSGAQNIN